MNTWGDAPTRITRAYWKQGWQWECLHCHYGHNVPWEEVATFADAVAAVEAHIKRHHELGMVETWRYAL